MHEIPSIESPDGNTNTQTTVASSQANRHVERTWTLIASLGARDRVQSRLLPAKAATNMHRHRCYELENLEREVEV
jgi:hypothetical protein